MAVVRGVDGCAGGWLCASLDLETGRVSAQLVADAQTLLCDAAPIIDIPIGLPKVGPRGCDKEARALLGPRASAVFPAPVRASLPTQSYEAACDASFAACGRRLSRQTFGILPKIREVDSALRQSPHLAMTVLEVHPELSFYFWSNRQPQPCLHESASEPTLVGCASKVWLVQQREAYDANHDGGNDDESPRR